MLQKLLTPFDARCPHPLPPPLPLSPPSGLSHSGAAGKSAHCERVSHGRAEWRWFLYALHSPRQPSCRWLARAWLGLPTTPRDLALQSRGRRLNGRHLEGALGHRHGQHRALMQQAGRDGRCRASCRSPMRECMPPATAASPPPPRRAHRHTPRAIGHHRPLVPQHVEAWASGQGQ